MSKPEEMMIDDVKYVRADKAQEAEKLDGMDYVIVRSYDAGCEECKYIVSKLEE